MAAGVVRIELSQQQTDYLRTLVAAGLWGKTLEEVCMGLILRGIQEAWPILPDEFNKIALSR
jgi:hypothetical protein